MSGTTQPGIEVRGLTKHYGGVVAVNALDFCVPPGSVTALLGGNGAGKTTTLAMLLGLIKPTSGQIRVLGIDMRRHRHRALERMNFSSPYVELPHRLTVAENLLVYARLYGVADPRRRVAAVLTSMDLDELAGRAAGKLSAGQKTRVALAKALINEPDVLLLDEPTASLDPDTADWVRSYLQEYQIEHRATVMLASHNMAEVERMASEVLTLKDGRIVDRGRPSELIARYGRTTLEEVFLDIARNRREPAP